MGGGGGKGMKGGGGRERKTRITTILDNPLPGLAVHQMRIDVSTTRSGIVSAQGRERGCWINGSLIYSVIQWLPYWFTQAGAVQCKALPMGKSALGKLITNRYH